MIAEGLGGSFPLSHRARLFPLPFLPSACKPPSRSSRVHQRHRLYRTIAAVSNRCIHTLNCMYSSPALCPPPPSPVFTGHQPDILPSSVPLRSLRHSVGVGWSSSQQRLLTHIRDQCATFVLSLRSWRSLGSGSVAGPSVSDVLTSFSSVAHQSLTGQRASPLPNHPPPSSFSSTASAEFSSLEGPLPLADWSSLQLPSTSAFSSSPTSVVPLVAERVALPDSLHIVPLESVLPSDVVTTYSEAAPSSLLRPQVEVMGLDAAYPLRRPRVAGSRAEYVRLIGRLRSQGMVSFTATPKAVNGVFTVGKDADSDRLIIDAQPANRLFVDPPHVSLPDPSHLVQMQVPAGFTLFAGKSDLSNFYHHLGLPQWMQPYFSLPSLTAAELRSIGVDADCELHPMCVTVPMGFSHGVYLAETVHEHVVYSSGALSACDNIVRMVSPAVTAERALHGIIIDDFFLFSLNQQLAARQFEGVLAAYRRAGFVVKASKVVRPTAEPVKVIGFEVGGPTSMVCLSTESRFALVRATLAVLRVGQLTGTALAHLVGRWTWCMLVRRPALSVLQRVYRFIEAARRRRFDLWPTVRRELWMLLGLLPLLHARLDAPLFHRAIASDASELAAGVVATPLTPDLHRRLWPLCSTRRHAVLQTQLQSDSAANPLHSSRLLLSAAQRAELSIAGDVFHSFYDDVSDARWSTIVSKAWRDPEHINALELRAVLLAVHWVLSFPSSLTRRVFLLVDSTVAFFSLWKGRSSSPQLLLILRKIGALLLASGVSLLPGWVPSEVNPADNPSRLRSIDAA